MEMNKDVEEIVGQHQKCAGTKQRMSCDELNTEVVAVDRVKREDNFSNHRKHRVGLLVCQV